MLTLVNQWTWNVAIVGNVCLSVDVDILDSCIGPWIRPVIVVHSGQTEIDPGQPVAEESHGAFAIDARETRLWNGRAQGNGNGQNKHKLNCLGHFYSLLMTDASLAFKVSLNMLWKDFPFSQELMTSLGHLFGKLSNFIKQKGWSTVQVQENIP